MCSIKNLFKNLLRGINQNDVQHETPHRTSIYGPIWLSYDKT